MACMKRYIVPSTIVRGHHWYIVVGSLLANRENWGGCKLRGTATGTALLCCYKIPILGTVSTYGSEFIQIQVLESFYGTNTVETLKKLYSRIHLALIAVIIAVQLYAYLVTG